MNKRLKNVSCILPVAVIAIMMFLMTAANAGAEGAQEPPTLLRIAGEETEKQWAEMLGFQEPLKSLVVKQRYDSFIDLINDYQPDFFGTFSYLEETPKALYKAGLIEPFAPTSAMLEEIASMSPLIQQVFHSELMTEDGQLLAYPGAGSDICYVPGFIGYWVPDAWAASPFRDITPPSSFEELLDFVEVFLNTPHDGFRLFYGTAGTKQKYLSELFRNNLLEGWVLRCKVAGMPVVFSDPKFIELAGRAQKLYKRLLKVDFKKKVNTKVRYLLAERQQYGLSFNAKDTFTCANIIPLRITSDQPPLFNVTMDSLQCVRKGSNYASSAPALFETAIPHVEKIRDMTCYDWWTFPDKFDPEDWNQDLKKYNGTKYMYMTKEWLTSIRTLDQSIVPCMEKTDWCIESQYGACMRAQQQFWIDGKLTAEEYAAEMDREWAAAIDGANDVDMWIEDFPEDTD